MISRLFTAFITFIMGAQAFGDSAFHQIDFGSDYLKLTKVGDPGKMLVEKCNQAVFKRLPHPTKPGRKKRTAVRTPINRFKCAPITGDWAKTCFDFVPKSEAEAESEQLGGQAALTGIVFFPLLFFAVGEMNHVALLQKTRSLLEQESSETIFIGIDRQDKQLLRINAKIGDSEEYTSTTIESYINPFRVGMYTESKFVRRLLNGVMNRVFTKTVTVDGEKVEKKYKADLSCH